MLSAKDEAVHLKLLAEFGAYWRHPYRYSHAINPYKCTMTHGIQRETAHIIRPGFYDFQRYDFENPEMRRTYSFNTRRIYTYPRNLPQTPANLREVTLCGILAYEEVDSDKVARVCKTCHKVDISIEKMLIAKLAKMSRKKIIPQRDKRGRFAPKSTL